MGLCPPCGPRHRPDAQVLLLLCSLMMLPGWLGGQSSEKHTISGYVRDGSSGEVLIGANVFDKELQAGTTTNNYGFFSLTLPAGERAITVSYISYQSELLRITLDKSLELNFQLKVAAVAGDTVEVVAVVERIEERTRMSTVDIPVSHIRSLPVLLGEVDVLKAIQLLPGVQSGNEGSTGLYVRGGGPDQNLILLDDAPVYNASHLFGFFSVFNADAINAVRLTKGGFPARYGGRLSSVLEITMKEGNNQEFRGSASIGLVASRLTAEGPLRSQKTSFILSGRRTYIDLLAKPFLNDEDGTGGYYFYDLNAKVNHTFSSRNRLFFSIYTGRDNFYADDPQDFELDMGWGNITSTLRWNRVLNNQLFANTTLTYSRYRFDIGSSDFTTDSTGNVASTYFASYFSGIRDWSAKVDFDFDPDPNHAVRFGAGTVFHTFSPGAFQYEDEGLGVFTTIAPSSEIDAWESHAYLEDDIRFSRRFSANPGIHFSMFSVDGKHYTSIQPRISARYLVRPDLAVKASTVTMQQYIHLLTNSGVGLPTDLWVPATRRVAPQRSLQVALGLARTLEQHQIEISLEGYYKTMEDLIEYEQGAIFINLDEDWQNKVVSGSGESYGVELFLQKKSGRSTGWLGYTLSWSNRSFDALNFGETFPYRYDRRHDLKLVYSHTFGGGLEFSGTWVFGTGQAISLPTAKYSGSNTLGGFFWIEGLYNHYPTRNGYRMASYHRLDLGLRFVKRKENGGERVWSIGLYNAYNHKNPYFIFFGNDDNGNRVAKQATLFPIIPSISYSFTF